MTRDEIIDKLYDGKEGSLDFPFEDAIVLSKMLIERGYAVCLTSGDLGDEIKVSWVFAGDVGNQHYSDINNVLFAPVDYLEMFVYGDYEEEENEVEDE